MDKTAIKNFAINARNKLISDIKLKAAEKLNVMLDNESASKASVEVNITIDDYSSKKLDQLDANLNEEDEI